MLYDVSLKIAYDYTDVVGASRHLVRLMPADLPGEQRSIAAAMTVTPKPQEWNDRIDFFGNRFTEILLDKPHEKVVFDVKARVDRQAAGPRFDMSPPLERLAADLAAYSAIDPASPHHFTAASIRVPLESATSDYAREVMAAEASTLDAVNSLNAALHRDMTFDAETTTVETPMQEAFARRRGVCQDYSHIMIACLRGVGVPAGYVSGYLRTIAPRGQARLEGADAMHAWVRAWCGAEMGWVEFDPTNGVMAGEDHIIVARARDYFDISPVKGVMRSAGEQSSTQAVDVVPLDI